MAEPLGKPLDITKYLGKTNNCIHRVGIELEGGWAKLPPGTEVMRDGSIRLANISPATAITIKHIGEIPSHPLELNDFPKWLKQFYPSVVNETCGLHVHLSFKTAFAYQKLMCPEYPGTVVAYMAKWASVEKLPEKHPIWPRLSGKNEYCQHVFYADEQAKTNKKDYDHHRQGHRYTVMSYRWARYGTIECRLLPMFDKVEQAERAINEIISITNAFMRAISAKGEGKINIKLEDNEGELREEKRIFV